MSPSPIHKASLVDSALHSPALLELVDQKISRPIIEYVIDSVIDTVDFAMGHPSNSRRGRSISRHGAASSFATMVHNVLTRAEVEMPVILTTLAYLDRARPHLHIALEEWANERVFLGALIVASKYTNDSSLKNIHWAMCTGTFGKRDVGRIEREFLGVLDWELSISESDVLAHHANLSLLIPALQHSPVPVTLSPPSSPASPLSPISSSPMPTLQHSPASSAASLSPRTPHTFVDDHMHVDFVKSTHAQKNSVEFEQHELSVPKHHSNHHHHSSTHSALKLLRNFPFPRHHHHHHQYAPAQSVGA